MRKFSSILRLRKNSIIALFSAMVLFSITSNAQNYVGLPFYETFSDTAVANARWTFINQSGTNHWVIGNNLGTGDTTSMYVSSGNGTDYGYNFNSESFSIAYVDVMIPDSGNYCYSYEYINQDGDWAFDFMRVALVPSTVDIQSINVNQISAGNVPYSWKPMGSYPEASDWTNIKGKIYNMTPGVYHLLVIWKNNNTTNGGKPGAIDNIILQKDKCYQTSDIRIIESGTDSIRIGWSYGYGQPDSIPNLWQVRCDQFVDTVTSPYNTYTFHNLTPATQYNIKVRMICGVDDTGMYTTTVAYTSCNNYSLPYYEDFENVSNHTITSIKNVHIPCWQESLIGIIFQNSNPHTPYVKYNTQYTHSGNYVLQFEENAYAILPKFDVPLDSIEISFWMLGNGVTVGVMENLNFQQFTPIQYCPATSNTNFIKYTIRFDNYTGNGKYIAIKSVGVGGSTSCFNMIDDLTVDYIPYCMPVTNLIADSIDSNIIHLTWDDSDATQYIVDYGTANHIPGSGSTNTTSDSNHLIFWPETTDTIDVYVRTVCSTGDSSTWTGPLTIIKPIEHTTCLTPSGLTADYVSITSATLNWINEESQNNWELHVWNSNYDTLINTETKPVTIEGLTSNTTYNASVKAICNNGLNESDNSDTLSFTTNECPIPTSLTANLITSNSAQIIWNGSGQNYIMEYGAENFTVGTGQNIENIATTIYTLTGLTPNSTYDVIIRAMCTDQSMSDWSERVTFTTTDNEGIAESTNNNVTIYPNPASRHVTIELSSEIGIANISIIDISGRQIYSSKMNCTLANDHTIDLTGIPQGAYFINISSPTFNTVRKLIIK